MKVRITHNATASGYLAFFFEHAGYLAAVTEFDAWFTFTNTGHT
jgi:hypothetical protein